MRIFSVPPLNQPKSACSPFHPLACATIARRYAEIMVRTGSTRRPFCVACVFSVWGDKVATLKRRFSVESWALTQATGGSRRLAGSPRRSIHGVYAWKNDSCVGFVEAGLAVKQTPSAPANSVRLSTSAPCILRPTLLRQIEVTMV